MFKKLLAACKDLFSSMELKKHEYIIMIALLTVAILAVIVCIAVYWETIVNGLLVIGFLAFLIVSYIASESRKATMRGVSGGNNWMLTVIQDTANTTPYIVMPGSVRDIYPNFQPKHYYDSAGKLHIICAVDKKINTNIPAHSDSMLLRTLRRSNLRLAANLDINKPVEIVRCVGRQFDYEIDVMIL